MSSKISRRAAIRRLALAGGAHNVDDAHTLVCVFLRGGADTLNLLVPYGDDQYYRARPTISVRPPTPHVETKDGAARLDDFYAFHPLMRPLLPAFREGRLGFVQAVGSDNPTGSHFEAQDQIEHGEGYGRAVGGGWLGRHLQSRGGVLTPLSAVAVGASLPESLRSSPSASALRSLDEIQIKAPSGDARAVSLALSAMYGEGVAGALSRPGRETIELLRRVESLRGVQYQPEGNAPYPDHAFATALREVARLVKARVGLEVACVDLDGWDTHFFQGTTEGLQAAPIDALARGLAAFDSDLIHHRDRVTTVVMTEFGRRNYENSSLGTDHGRGFALMAMGGRVVGGKVHGAWPGLDGEELTGPGGLTVMIDYRSVLSEILAGTASDYDRARVFPDFYPEFVGIMRAASR